MFMIICRNMIVTKGFSETLVKLENRGSCFKEIQWSIRLIRLEVGVIALVLSVKTKAQMR